MKIILSEEAGGPETLRLRERAAPEPGADEVRIAVRFVGINYPDALIIEDRYQSKPDRPFAPGGECSGVIDAVGSGVSGFKVGDRVMALPLLGGLAEKLCIRADACHLLPEGVTDMQAAALQMAYGTALYAIKERGAVKAGETVVVLGAAGGVGLASVEIAKAMGARVVAVASTEEKLSTARDHGADIALLYPPGSLDRAGQKELSTKLHDAVGPKGADIVMDVVGGDYSEPALRCMGWGGRFLVVGFPAGIPKLPANIALFKSCDIRGVSWGEAMERDPSAHRHAMTTLLHMCATGAINPRIHEIHPLADAGKAIATLSRRAAIGKVLVSV